MSKTFGRFMTICALTLTLTFSLTCGLAQADDVKSLLKKINNELRLAQKGMFSGKADGAIAKLGPIKDMLDQVKQSDPEQYQNKILRTEVPQTGQGPGAADRQEPGRRVKTGGRFQLDQAAAQTGGQNRLRPSPRPLRATARPRSWPSRPTDYSARPKKRSFQGR